MKFLADENFPALVVRYLREAGLDVRWVRTDFQGIDDEMVLQKANEEQRIILTFDKDFGEIAFRDKLNTQNGIVLFRLAIIDIEISAIFIRDTILSRNDWASHFSVIEKDKIRMRKIE